MGIDPFADPKFPLIGKLLGQKGSFVKHIANETGTKVQLKGRGSGYVEAPAQTGTTLHNCTSLYTHELAAEAPEPLFLHIIGTSQKGVQDAKGLAENLIAHVKQDYAEYLATKNAHPPLKYSKYFVFNRHI